MEKLRNDELCEFFKKEIISSFIDEYLEYVSVSKNGTHIFSNCPFCDNKRFHFDYNNGNPIWNCFSCCKSGSLNELLLSVKYRKYKKFDVKEIKELPSGKRIMLKCEDGTIIITNI